MPKDTKMFLQSSSSKSVRSKILTAEMEVDQDYQRHRQSRGSTSSRFEDKANTNEGKNPSLSFSNSTQQSSFNSEDDNLKKINFVIYYCQGYEQKAIGIGLCPC